MVTTPEIAQVLTRRSYFNTFGGNPVCTATGHAVLKVIEKERLQENASVVGSYLKDRLNALQKKHESKHIFLSSYSSLIFACSYAKIVVFDYKKKKKGYLCLYIDSCLVCVHMHVS